MIMDSLVTIAFCGNATLKFAPCLIRTSPIERRMLCTCFILDWRSLYVAGRLHKPVLEVHSASSTASSHSATEKESQGCVIRDAINTNLRNAVHAALISLPSTFCEWDLYTTIAALSYRGVYVYVNVCE